MKERLLFPFLFSLLLFSGFALAMDPEGCLECHGLRLVRGGEVARSLEVTEKGFSLSSHSSLRCSDCHVRETVVPHPEGESEPVCVEVCHVEREGDELRKNHREKFYAYQKDIHFQEKISCSSCHSDSGPVGSPVLSLRCLVCHGRNEKGEGEKLLLSTPVHGNLTGAGGEVSCGDCHSPHVKRGEKGEPLGIPSCFRGIDCHGEKIVTKVSLGDHRGGKGGWLIRGATVAVRIFVVLLVGTGLIVVRRAGRME